MTEHPLEQIQASFSIGQRWHVFYTGMNAEKQAYESISGLGFETFIPFEKRIQRRPNRKPRTYETALFARYGFVKFDITKPSWGAILKAKGVIEILAPCGVPATVQDFKIDALKLAMNVGVFDRTRPPSVGMSVEVTGGPFQAFIGKIKRARTDDRMKVLLNIFGSEVETDIPLKWLREVA